MRVLISDEMLRRTRYCLRQALPGIKAAHISEAVASALGFQTGLALSAWLVAQDAKRPKPRQMDFAAFLSRLDELGYCNRLTLVTQSEEPTADVCTEPGTFWRPLEQSHAEILRALRGRSDQSGSDPDWMTRIEALLTASLQVLEWLRQRNLAELSASALLDLISFDRLMALANGSFATDIPMKIRNDVAVYLDSLPGYVAKLGNRQAQETLDMHGYAQMLMTLVLPSPTRDTEASFHDTMMDRTTDIMMLGFSERDDPTEMRRRILLVADTSWRKEDDWTIFGAHRLDDLEPGVSFPLARVRASNRSILVQCGQPNGADIIARNN